MSTEPAGEVVSLERVKAKAAAEAIRAMMARRKGGAPKLKPSSVTHADARPKYWWMYEWEKMPGLRFTRAGSTRSDKTTQIYTHDLLPGWEYRPDELWELLQDLDNLAAGKGQPTAPTRNPRKGAPQDGSDLDR